MSRPPSHPLFQRPPIRRLWLVTALAPLMLCLAFPALAKKTDQVEMEQVIRQREMSRLQREYQKNFTVEDELYQYEKDKPWQKYAQDPALKNKGYDYWRDRVDRRQDIMPLSNGDRYLSDVFWLGGQGARAVRDDLPDWLQSKEFLEQRAAGKEQLRVSPVGDAPADEVRAIYGADPLGRKLTWSGVTLESLQKYDPRTQKWYPAYAEKNHATGKWEYDFTGIGRAVMMENIRRDTLWRLGPEKYRQLMAHARTRTPEYKIERLMAKVRSEAQVYDKGQGGFVARARSGPPPRETAAAKVETLPSRKPSAKDRQKEMEQKADAQQRREAEQQTPEPVAEAGAGVPVIPDTCVIDIVGWVPDRPGSKWQGTLWLSGGKVAWAKERRIPAKAFKGTRTSAQTCITVFRGTLKDNVISGNLRMDCTPVTYYWTSSSGACSEILNQRFASSEKWTLHLDGSFDLEGETTGHTQRTTSNEQRCGRSSSQSSSRAVRFKGTWRIRKGGGAGGRSWSDKWGSHRVYNPDAVVSGQ